MTNSKVHLIFCQALLSLSIMGCSSDKGEDIPTELWPFVWNTNELISCKKCDFLNFGVILYTCLHSHLARPERSRSLPVRKFPIGSTHCVREQWRFRQDCADCLNLHCLYLENDLFTWLRNVHKLTTQNWVKLTIGSLSSAFISSVTNSNIRITHFFVH